MSAVEQMPRFFIDTFDQRDFVGDDVGTEYVSLDQAKDAAIAALTEMARDELPDGDAPTFPATVRREDGRIAVQATLTLQVTYVDPD